MMKHIVRIFIKITGFPSAILFFKCKIYYINKKLQSRRIKGAAILMANHKSPLDFILFLSLFPTRYLRCIVGETIYERNKVLRWFLRNLGSIKVDRFARDLSFIGQSVDILNSGGVIEIYPEGRLPINNEEMLPFKPSIVFIALQSGAPIIPIYHTGNYGMFKREKVVIGEPILLQKYCLNLNPPIEEIERLTAILQGEILNLKEFYERKTDEKKRKT